MSRTRINSISDVYQLDTAKTVFNTSMTFLGKSINTLTARFKDIELVELEDEVKRAKDLYKRFSALEIEKMGLKQIEEVNRQIDDMRVILGKIEAS